MYYSLPSIVLTPSFSTGASKTVVYLDRNRNKPNVQGESMSTMQSPSHGVHTDLTIASCPYLLKLVIPDDEEVERLLNRRFMVVNVWRPIKPIRRDPLGVCNWKSVNPSVDIYNDRRVSSEGVMEFGLPIFNEKHEWYYLSGQRPDEPLLFKQLDSNPATNITLLHSAFVDPKYADYPARESIEMKIFAFFDEE